MIDERDRHHLRRAITLAETALERGHEPFGSVLVSGDGTVLFEAHNEVGTGDATRHPEFTIARWAAENMEPAARQRATVYTSGEHCPMCAAAHGLVGLGRIVYASSSAQRASWNAELGRPATPVLFLPINDIAPGIPVEGPVDDLAQEILALHRRRHQDTTA